MLSRISYFLCTALVLYASFVFYPRWKQYGGENTISWDAAGYYWYLPAAFIYHDIKEQKFNDSIINKYHPLGDFGPGYKLDNGNYVFKYPSGLAVMSLPFFAVAHVSAKMWGYPQDGFSPPYPLALQIGGMLIALLGLWYFRKLLLLFYSDTVAAVCLVLLVFGTNYLDFAAINLGMTHSWLFTLYVFLILNSYYFYQTPTYKYAIRIGLIVGLATLTRPTEIISALIPLLWGLDNLYWATIKNRVTFWWQQWSKIIVAGVLAIAVMFIQPVYWKYVSGHWLVYSYQDQGFSWNHPHLVLYAFNYMSGWMNYSPMMLLAILGLLPFMLKGRNRVAVLVFFVVDYYIVSSWNIWWYGGRAMIQCYPILFLPFASLIDVAIKKKVWLWVLTPVVLLFVYFNIWLTYQQHHGTIYSVDNMTKAYYLRVAGRWHVPEETKKLRDNPDLYEGIPRNLTLVYQHDFESDTELVKLRKAINGERSLYLDKIHPNSVTYRFQYSGGADVTWLRTQATIRCVTKEWQLWNIPQFIVHYYKGDKEVKTSMIRIDRFIDEGETKDLYIDTRVPEEAFDAVGISFWNADSDKELLIDDLKVWSFN